MNNQDLQEYVDVEIWGCINESTANLKNGAYKVAVKCETLDDLEVMLRNWLIDQQSNHANSREWKKYDAFGEVIESVWHGLPAYLFTDQSINIGDIMDTVIGWLPSNHPLRAL